mmetsp:Transcript_13310/g.25497  ORF Transcript_13310/g.25497 Transcript_13310/m.25497 type:complete len:151 (-) Transcript_13310:403-855(-)
MSSPVPRPEMRAMKRVTTMTATYRPTYFSHRIAQEFLIRIHGHKDHTGKTSNERRNTMQVTGATSIKEIEPILKERRNVHISRHTHCPRNGTNDNGSAWSHRESSTSTNGDAANAETVLETHRMAYWGCLVLVADTKMGQKTQNPVLLYQ